MATSGPTNLPAFFNVDADFRTWGSAINAALAALGLVQTGDTGQINWTTVVKPASGSAASGYEIWRFADALQATVPVFIKLEYGSGSTADRPALWCTVGSGSNGSGTLTGQLSGRQSMTPINQKAAGVTLPMVASGNTGELQLGVNLDYASANFGMFLSVERPKDATDTVTNDGVFFVWSSTSGNGQCVFIPASGTVPGSASNGNWPAVNPGQWSRSGAGATADVCPLLIPIFGNWRYSHVMVASRGDFTGGGTLTPTIFGATHTYLALGNAATPSANTLQGGNIDYMMRWE